jgi:hypothetical protein
MKIKRTTPSIYTRMDAMFALHEEKLKREPSPAVILACEVYLRKLPQLPNRDSDTM